MNTLEVEALRRCFRPARITTLFVGESAPFNGDFFCRGNPPVTQHMRVAIEESLGSTDDFLATFKGYGWWLDDLVLTPVDRLDPRDRVKQCEKARGSLAERIAKNQPQAVVSLAKRIAKDVDAAMRIAGCDVRHINTLFPRMGWQTKFKDELRDEWAKLPRHVAPK